MRTNLRLFACFALALLPLASCASRGGGVEPSRPSPGSAADAPVRPGDEVFLAVWNEPEMSDTFAVAQGGELILPKLGPLDVTGQSVSMLQDSIRRAYARYLRNPSIQITVLRRVGVSGAVRQPGVFMVDLTESLPDVIVRAGGLVETADPNRIHILRADERLRFRTDDREMFVGAELRSGDQIVVDHKNFFQRNPIAVITTAVPLIGYIVTVILPAFREE